MIFAPDTQDREIYGETGWEVDVGQYMIFFEKVGHLLLFNCDRPTTKT